MVENLTALREHIAELGKLMFDRFGTDTAGGNISARAGRLICITAAHSGARYQWRISPEQVLVVDDQGNKLDGDGEISREAKVHLHLYRDFSDGQAVVHGHPRNVMVFASAARPIYPVIECAVKIGVVNVVPYAPAHSTRLAENIAAGFKGCEERIRKFAAAVLAPYHGLFVLGKDLDTSFDAAERINVNAYCVLMSRLLPGEPIDITTHSTQLLDSIHSFNE